MSVKLKIKLIFLLAAILFSISKSCFADPNLDLFEAINKGKLDDVKSAVAKGADIKAKDWQGVTPLNYASRNGNVSIVKYLVERGADVNEVLNGIESTALKEAVMRNHFEVVKYLVERGADIHIQDTFNKHSPLMLAVQFGNTDIVAYLISKGANPEVKDHLGHNAFDYAEGNQVLLNILQGKPSKDKDLAAARLVTAVTNGKIEEVRSEISKGADINKKLDRGESLLLSAIGRKYFDIADYLIDQGADVNAKDDSGFTAIIRASLNNNINLLKKLLAKGAQINAKNKDGNTALMLAVKYGSFDMVRYLIDNGADLNGRNNGGETVLIMACDKLSDEKDSPERLKMVDFLLGQKQDISAKSNFGSSPLSNACMWGNTKLAQYLIEKGADINTKTSTGQTPLIIAAYGGHMDLVKLLVEKGADLEARSNDGKSALDIAKHANNFLVADYLAGLQKDKKEIIDPLALLFDAVKNNDLKAVKYAQERGADLKKDYQGTSILNLAVRTADPDMINYLIANGAEVNKRCKEFPFLEEEWNGTILMVAIFYPRPEMSLNIVETLVKNGAEVNVKDNLGNTPLFFAIYKQNPDIVKYLVEKGAKVNEKNREGQTALDLIKSQMKDQKSEEILKILAEAQTSITAGKK